MVDRGDRTGAWRWAGAWAVVGAGWSFTMLAALSIGIFVLPFVLALTVAVARQPAARPTAGAVVSGLGLPLLFVAFLNRRGPGERCTVTPTSTHCTEHLSPWPFLLAGIVLVVLGCLLVALRSPLRR